MQDPQDDDPLAFDEIRNDVGQAGDDEFARPFYASRPPETRVVLERVDLAQDFQDDIDRRQGIVTLDVGLDSLQITASGGRPLQPHVLASHASTSASCSWS